MAKSRRKYSRGREAKLSGRCIAINAAPLRVAEEVRVARSKAASKRLPSVCPRRVRKAKKFPGNDNNAIIFGFL